MIYCSKIQIILLFDASIGQIYHCSSHRTSFKNTGQVFVCVDDPQYAGDPDKRGLDWTKAHGWLLTKNHW